MARYLSVVRGRLLGPDMALRPLSMALVRGSCMLCIRLVGGTASCHR